MPPTPLKCVVSLLVIVFSCICTAGAQDPTEEKTAIIPFLHELEGEFNIKFSYLDADLKDVFILPPENKDLPGILNGIRTQTGLSVEKLSDRYYSLFLSDTVDICAMVTNNFEEPITEGASVQVLGSDMAVVTDENGYFNLENVSRQAVLRVGHLGYKPYIIPASELAMQKPCGKIILSIQYQQLDEVVVSKILTSGISRQWDGSMLLNSEEFGILPGLIEPDVLQSVQALPGIRSIDETVSDINIRGGTNDQNLLLWDGIKMYQSGHFFGLISAFNPYLTEEVTIVKNGTSAAYGEGVSGIISIQTKDQIADRIYGGAGVNLINGDLYAHLPVNESLAFQFSARRSVTDFLNTPTYNQFYDRAFQDTEIRQDGEPGSESDLLQEETFYFYDLSGKVLYDLNDDHKLRFSIIHINNHLDYLESSETADESNLSVLEQTNLSFGGTLDSQWSERFNTRVNAYYTRYLLDAVNTAASGQQQLRQENEVFETSFRLEGRYGLTETLTWLNGYQWTEVGITNFTNVTQPPFNSNIKGVIRTHAPYTEVQYETANHRLHISGGARFNAIANLETFSTFRVEPRLRLNMGLGGPFRMEILGELKNQTTNQIVDLEQNFLGIEKRRWILSNTDTDTLVGGNPNEKPLPVVRSKQISLGFFYDEGPWFLSTEGFLKEVEGISTATQGFQNEGQFDGEIGSYSVGGLEFLINHKNDWFSSWLSYSYSANTYTFEALDPSSFPNNLDIRHTLTLAGTYTQGGLKLGAGIHYRSGKPYTQPQEAPNELDTSVFPNRINYRDPNSSRLPDYLRADASATYEFPLSRYVRASVGASLLNILNRKNKLNTYYRLNADNEIETVESLSLGLTPNISFRVDF